MKEKTFETLWKSSTSPFDIIGKISQRKREPLNSDLEIQLGYTLVGVVLNTFLETPIQPTFLSEEPIFSSLQTYS